MTNELSPTPDQGLDTEPLYRLLRSMAPRRTVLLGILAFCDQPQSIEAIDGEVDRLQENNRSVYGASSLCIALDDADGLERVTAEGVHYSEIDLEPIVVEDEDGTSHYETPDAPALFWRTTKAGEAVLAADDPAADAQAMLATEQHLSPIYARVLTLCDAPDGCTTPQVGAAVDKDPLVQDPRLFAGHFIERLESVGCLTWKKDAWHTTDLGRTIANELSAN